MDIVIINKKNQLVDIWADWTGVVPSIGDTIIVYVGDHREIPMTRPVLERIVDGGKPNKVTLVIDLE